MSATVAKILRYPVKGLSAQELGVVDLVPGEGLPQDRRFAIAHGASTFDPMAPAWRPKTNFVVLARHEKLATLQTEFDEETCTLVVRRGGRPVARGRIDTPMGRTLIGQFLAAYLGDHIPGAPKIVEAPGHMFSDAKEKYVSLINAASVRDLERVVQQPVDPVRFRGNLLVEGLAPWAEAKWVGRTLAIGDARLEVVGEIDRCAATNVNPGTGARDMNIPQALQRGYGHINCGIYGRVLTGGHIRTGDAITVS